MKRVSNWEEILKKAWSVRFGILAAAFGGIETFCLVLDKVFLDAPQGLIGGIGGVFAALAVISRILDQPTISPKEITVTPTPE